MRTDNIGMLYDTLDIFSKGYYEVNGRRVNLKLSPKEREEIMVFLPEDIQALGGRENSHDFQRVADHEDFQNNAENQDSQNDAENQIFQHTHGMKRIGTACENMDSYSLARKRYEDYPDLFGQGFRDCPDMFGRGSKPVLVLNLANSVSPGGGVRRGAKAQEEDLCRKSSLLLSLESGQAAKYYQYNRALHTNMGSDAVMITPQVEIIKDEKGRLLEDSVIVSVMTCAAPMLIYGREGMTEQEYRDMVYGRICGMLKVAAHLGYRVLVLGAFGCGAFENDAHLISDFFYKALKAFDYDGMRSEDAFDRVDFAVMDHSRSQYNYREFARNFADFYREEDGIFHENGQAREYTFFWLDDGENGEFSNWYQREFVIDDFRYFCVEQYMMAQKAKLFHDSRRYTAILRANTPAGCKALGKQVTPFDARAWDAVKYDVVKAGNRAKFEQNPDLMRKLLATGDSILAEASPKDKIWGIGLEAGAARRVDPSKWPGQNLLGKALMEIREEKSIAGNRK